MKNNKTKPEKTSPYEFLNNTIKENRKLDSIEMLQIMQKTTGAIPIMWGPSIIGFGSYKYESARTGRSGEWMTIGFSPRSSALTLYGLLHDGEQRDLVSKLGDVTTGKGCIYIKDLSKIEIAVLEKMIKSTFLQKNGKYLKL